MAYHERPAYTSCTELLYVIIMSYCVPNTSVPMTIPIRIIRNYNAIEKYPLQNRDSLTTSYIVWYNVDPEQKRVSARDSYHANVVLNRAVRR